jgi:hypothetical protein
MPYALAGNFYPLKLDHVIQNTDRKTVNFLSEKRYRRYRLLRRFTFYEINATHTHVGKYMCRCRLQPRLDLFYSSNWFYSSSTPESVY